jgi:hypothetical protein
MHSIDFYMIVSASIREFRAASLMIGEKSPCVVRAKRLSREEAVRASWMCRESLLSDRQRPLLSVCDSLQWLVSLATRSASLGQYRRSLASYQNYIVQVGIAWVPGTDTILSLSLRGDISYVDAAR